MSDVVTELKYPVPGIALKNPFLAAFLGWLIPGAGHLYQGRTAKGLLFMVCILSTFVYGYTIGGGHVVYKSTSHQQWYWQYYPQAVVGLPALPALFQSMRVEAGKKPLFDGFMAPPQNRLFRDSKDKMGNVVVHPNEFSKWGSELAGNFEIGSVFTMIAGLLNALAIYDAFAGPMVSIEALNAQKNKS